MDTDTDTDAGETETANTELETEPGAATEPMSETNVDTAIATDTENVSGGLVAAALAAQAAEAEAQERAAREAEAARVAAEEAEAARLTKEIEDAYAARVAVVRPVVENYFNNIRRTSRADALEWLERMHGFTPDIAGPAFDQVVADAKYRHETVQRPVMVMTDVVEFFTTAPKI